MTGFHVLCWRGRFIPSYAYGCYQFCSLRPSPLEGIRGYYWHLIAAHLLVYFLLRVDRRRSTSRCFILPRPVVGAHWFHLIRLGVGAVGGARCRFSLDETLWPV